MSLLSLRWNYLHGEAGNEKRKEKYNKRKRLLFFKNDIVLVCIRGKPYERKREISV
ncbi:hypothetical protein SRABI82_03760 [Priestia megaterium]|nr:hypothetical protein SRABI82_03760 [Priestia megaterium]